jgi:hypothetical protein
LWRRHRVLFLWTFLVVRSLVNGLENLDRFIDLLRRLREFPSDLNEFFAHIFRSLEPVYRVQVARAFLVALTATQPLSPIAYWFLDLDEDQSRLLDDLPTEPLDEEDYTRRTVEIKCRLNGRCKGLLEVARRLHPWKHSSIHIRRRFDYVDFLHRTVRDFLRTEEMHRTLTGWATRDFNADLVICRIILAEIKTFKPGDIGIKESLEYPKSLICAIGYHARMVEVCTATVPRSLSFLCLGPTTCYIYVELDKNGKLATLETGYNFLAFAVQWNLVLYVQSQLDLDPVPRAPPSRPYLLQALCPRIHDRITPHLEMVQLLLQHDADPNEGPKNSTVWGQFLSSIDSNECYNRSRDIYYDVLKALLTHGADSLFRVQQLQPGKTASDVIKRVFTPILSLCASRGKGASKASRSKRPATDWIRKYVFLSRRR